MLRLLLIVLQVVWDIGVPKFIIDVSGLHSPIFKKCKDVIAIIDTLKEFERQKEDLETDSEPTFKIENNTKEITTLNIIVQIFSYLDN